MTTIETQSKIAALTNGQLVKVAHFYYQTILETEAIVHRGITSCGRDYFYCQPIGDSHPGASITKQEILDVL